MYKLKLLCSSIYMMILFSIRNFLSKEKIVNSTSRPKLIVSLTTFTERINKVHLTIESIFHQDVPFDYEVRLYLSEDEFNRELLPNTLIRLEERGLKIIFVGGNIRSYKKLHYAYSEKSGLPIVTSDDDIFYPRNWLRKLYENHQENPFHIIYMRGREITFNNGDLNKYTDFPLSSGAYPKRYVIPTGVSGILYPVGCFYIDYNRLDIIQELAPYADDLWYRVMSGLNNVDCILIGGKSIHFPPVLGTQSMSLRKINVDGDSKNDDQFRALIERYPFFRKE